MKTGHVSATVATSVVLATNPSVTRRGRSSKIDRQNDLLLFRHTHNRKQFYLAGNDDVVLGSISSMNKK